MRKVLIVCMNSTEERTGGGNGALQNSLCFHAAFKDDEIHYFGLASAFWKSKAAHYREVGRSRASDMWARVLLRTNFLCLEVDAFLEETGASYDVAFLSNSRLGYVAKALRPRVRLLLTYYANIEVDYIRHKYRTPLVGLLDLAIFRLREAQCARITDFSFFITPRDMRRHAELYGPSRSAMLPAAVPARKAARKAGAPPRVVFFGSLAYAPNVSAVRWIVKEILPRTDRDFLLAGSSPTAEVRAMAEAGKGRIEFHPDFATLDGLLGERDVFLSPLAEGAGMKVKVADCTAMALPVLGSEENFVGYEAMPHVDWLICRTPEDYLRKLDELSDPARYAEVASDLHAAWRNLYSMEASTAAFGRALAALEGKAAAAPGTLSARTHAR